MTNLSRTKQELFEENAFLQQSIQSLEISQAQYRLAEEALRESYVARYSLTGIMLFASDAMYYVTGYKPEEIIGTSGFDRVHPDDRFQVQSALTETIEKGVSNKAEYRAVCKDGGYKWVEILAKVVHNDQTGQDEVIAVVSNITDRKRTEEELRERDIKFMKLSAWVPGMIYQFTRRADGTYCVPFATEAIKDIFGCSPQDVREDFSPIARVILPEDLDKVVVAIENSAKDLTIWTCEYRVQIPGKSIRWISGISTPEKSADGSITWHGFNTDITERKQVEKKLRDTLDSLRKSFSATVQVLVSAVEIRDPYTSGHQVRSADLARAIATEMGFSQERIDGIRMAGAIHDIGKMSVPAELLSKPTKLSELEFSLIKEHANKGFEMLKDVESPWPLAEIVYQHHERMDGSGYPRHLKGEEIIMEARILAVADVVEAMASHRPYRPAIGLNAALAEIENHKGTLYDSDAVDACLRLFREKGFQLERA